jgi:acetyl esterase/lipase
MCKIARAAIISFACLAFFPCHGQAQTPCSQKYIKKIFPKVDTARSIPYGKNVDVNGVTQTLLCDVYQPVGDTSRSRPLLVLTHGGSFISGDKSEPDIVRLCTAFSSRGYVTASINYRLGIRAVTGQELARANIRAIQDERAAVRYFRSRADSLRIDTSLIFAGGTSAGAFTAIHHAYFDQSEILPSIDTSGIGGFEGKSGTPGYSSHIRGVINCWGAIGDTTWINRGDLPIVSIHGTADATVPYDAGDVFGIQGIWRVFGSASIHQRAQHKGVYSVLRLFPGMGHQFPAASPEMDTAEETISGFLASVINCDSGKTPVSIAIPTKKSAILSWRLLKYDGFAALVEGTFSTRIVVSDLRGRTLSARTESLCGKTVLSIHAISPGTYIVLDIKNQVGFPLLICAVGPSRHIGW